MSKTIKGLIIGISVFLVIVLITVSILMFPLKGKTYDYDYWYRDKPYDINDTIRHSLMFTFSYRFHGGKRVRQYNRSMQEEK